MIKLERITKDIYHQNRKVSILKNINLKISKSDFIAIIGKSGAGKSALLNIIGLMDNEYLGEYIFYNTNLKDYTDDKRSKIRNQKIGFVFQNFCLLETMTVKENVELPLRYSKIPHQKWNSIVNGCLNKVNLLDRSNESVKVLSGGQRQRVAIARALAVSPDFIIADEPTGALDSVTTEEILGLLKQLNDNGVTIILVTHDKGCTKYCNRIIEIVDGELYNA